MLKYTQKSIKGYSIMTYINVNAPFLATSAGYVTL